MTTHHGATGEEKSSLSVMPFGFYGAAAGGVDLSGSLICAMAKITGKAARVQGLIRTAKIMRAATTVKRQCLILSDCGVRLTFLNGCVIVKIMGDSDSRGFFTPPRREFIAHGTLNLGLVFLTSGLLSDVFIQLSMAFRFAIVLTGAVSVVSSIVIFPAEGGK